MAIGRCAIGKFEPGWCWNFERVSGLQSRQRALTFSNCIVPELALSRDDFFFVSSTSAKPRSTPVLSLCWNTFLTLFNILSYSSSVVPKVSKSCTDNLPNNSLILTSTSMNCNNISLIVLDTSKSAKVDNTTTNSSKTTFKSPRSCSIISKALLN
ncbi:hypothetical protein WICPIJ_007081 [Wickerhamomyces pijperi]|uniref:Uncharacterized protein n=1 Tax=Wickerhamomyces pijperi TaxID=599730 RepID=A0A9P8Q0K2_WICPI|nr:hypothetical protein WICPIJ_007081 [Wickerhamomyces pijperi]